MLASYEEDHHTGMDLQAMAKEIYDFTDGYPYLVSRLCQIIDENDFEWNHLGMDDALRQVLNEKSSLFESLVNRLTEYPEVEWMVYRVLFSGERIVSSIDDRAFELAQMFGFLKNDGQEIRIANRIFETRLYNHFITSARDQGSEMFQDAMMGKNRFVSDGRLNMDLVLKRFIEVYHDIFGEMTERFVEEEGRKQFLLFLMPIINGTGNYYIEAQTRDRNRTDVIVDYLGEQFVIEMKIWRGDAYRKRGEKQLWEYLDYYHKDRGWMLSFCFNQDKEIGIREVRLGGKVIVEGIC